MEDPFLNNGHVQLTVRESWASQIKANVVQKLALRLIYGHAECQPHRKLPSAQFEAKFFVCQGDPGNQVNSTGKATSHNFTLEDSPTQLSHDQSGAVAESNNWIELP